MNRASDASGRCSVYDAVTLEQANAVMPLTPPARMTLKEKQIFYQLRADMYRRVADKDRGHYYEALACAGLEQEMSDKLAGESRAVEPPEQVESKEALHS